MSTAAILMDSHPSGDVAACVRALAWEMRRATGSLRVVVGAGGDAVAEPYLEARARVVGVGDWDERYHVRRRAETSGLPEGIAEDEADLIVIPGGKGDEATLAAVGRALAPGGVAVIGVRREEADGIAGRAARLGLALTRMQWVGRDVVVVVADRRAARPVPQALAGLDRTMCVERERVLRALAREPWVGDGSGRTAELVATLRAQVVGGEPELRALPWSERLGAASDGAAVDVLVVMPHPDDESVYAGGILGGLTTAGQRVRLVVATAGAGGRGGADLGRRRARELLAAARELGIEGARCLGWEDFGKYRDDGRTRAVTAGDALRRWGVERGLEDVVAEIRRARPRVLLGLDPEVDPNWSLHGHHLGLGVLVAVAFHAAADEAYAPWLGAAWACEEHRVMSPAAHERWGEVVEIDREVKRRALLAHESQAYSTARVLEELRDPSRAAVEIWRRVQARRTRAWWVARRERPSVETGIEWPREAARVRSVARPRAALVQALRQQLAGVDDPAVEESLQRLAREDAVAVVTGQQVGLLGGPAYTLAKAVSAVALARRLQRHGVTTVPVFWMASQDHDLDEVQRVPRLEGGTLRLGLPRTGAPVGALRLGAGIEALVERWAAELPEGHAGEVVAWVRRTHGAERSFAGAFSELLVEVMRGTGLLMLDPSDPALARLARPLLQRAVVEAEAVARALGEGRERLRAAGEREVVPTRHGGTQVFGLDEHGARRRVTREHELAKVVAAMEQHPERFSAAALLRPLVQDAMLPTIAYVAGPTEQRYLAQIHELYAWAGVPRPQVVRRASLRIAEAADVAALAPVGGIEALRGDRRPLERIGRSGLADAGRAWLHEVEALVGWLDTERRCARARLEVGLEGGALRERLERLEAGASTALAELPRTTRGWARTREALRERASAVLEGPGASSGRAVTRLRHALLGLSRSILRDGRRARAEAIAAWGRAGPVPAPAERRMTVAELLARSDRSLVTGMLAALEGEPSVALELQIGGRG